MAEEKKTPLEIFAAAFAHVTELVMNDYDDVKSAMERYPKLSLFESYYTCHGAIMALFSALSFAHDQGVDLDDHMDRQHSAIVRLCAVLNGVMPESYLHDKCKPAEDIPYLNTLPSGGESDAKIQETIRQAEEKLRRVRRSRKKGGTQAGTPRHDPGASVHAKQGDRVDDQRGDHVRSAEAEASEDIGKIIAEAFAEAFGGKAFFIEGGDDKPCPICLVGPATKEHIFGAHRPEDFRDLIDSRKARN